MAGNLVKYLLSPLPLGVKLGRLGRFIAEYHLGDPTGPDDDFAPLKRRKRLNDQVRAIAVGALKAEDSSLCEAPET